MQTLRNIALAAVLGAFALSAQAGDGKAEKPKPRSEPVKTEPKVVKVEKKEERGSCGFKRFWIHTVGGTIGNGLKSGASKIGNAFD